jgi:signal transduction histidine kinase
LFFMQENDRTQFSIQHVIGRFTAQVVRKVRVGQGLLLLLFLLVSLLLSACVPGGAGSDRRQALDTGWSVAIDRSRALTIADIAGLRFDALPGPPALGYVDGAVWLRHTLRADPARAGERLIELQLPGIDEATLFWPQPDGSFSARTAGDRHPMAGRDVRHRNIVFRVDLPAQGDVTFHLRVTGTHNQTFSVVLWEPAAFLEAALEEHLLWGALFALHVVLVLSNLWLFQATRDTPTGLFALYTTVSFGAIVLVEGFGHAHLLDGWPTLNHVLLVAFWMLSVPATYLFVFGFIELLDGTRRWPRRVVAAVAGAAALSLLIDLALAPTWIRPAFSTLQALSAPVLAGVLVWRSLQGAAAARLLLVAMTPTFAAVALKLLRNLGVLEPNLWIDSAYFFGLAFYLLVLNFGISRRVEALRRSKDRAQARALALSRRTESELERRVAQRTEQAASAMKRARDTLELERRVLAEQRVLFGTISHELRTPVAVIYATTQNLLLQQPAAAEPLLARYRKIHDACKQLSHLLNENLREDRFMAVAAITRFEQAQTSELLEDAVAMARLGSDHHGLQATVHGGAERTWCDPVLTRLALSVLAENAVKYTPPGTAVKLTAHVDRSGARAETVLEVVDDGPGVSPDELVRLFEPGYRGEKALATEGSGLGLALARRLVELQGGTLTLSSPPGQGFAGTIRLPGAPPQAA